VGPATNLALRLLGTSHDADDVVQESFLRALRGLDRLREPGAFAGWLGTIVTHAALVALRRRRVLEALGLRGPTEPDLDRFVSPLATPDAVLELRALYRALASLPADERIPLVLQRIEGMDLESIAATTGVSLATVKRRLVKAEARLRKVSGRAAAGGPR
jgi:RNA polymerase sigma-70 factor (ECF subfamily)